MKYIKAFKLYEEINYNDIKEYLVYEYNNNGKKLDYYIDKIVDIQKDSDNIHCNMLYVFNEETKSLDKIDDNTNTNYSPIEEYFKCVLFTADTIEECLKFIILYTESKKYNL